MTAIVPGVLLALDPDPQCLYGDEGDYVFYVEKLSVSDVSSSPSEYPPNRRFFDQNSASRRGPECPICYERFDNFEKIPAKTYCGHIMCVSCIVESTCMAQRLNKCPICRAELFDLPPPPSRRSRSGLAPLPRSPTSSGYRASQLPRYSSPEPPFGHYRSRSSSQSGSEPSGYQRHRRQISDSASYMDWSPQRSSSARYSSPPSPGSRSPPRSGYRSPTMSEFLQEEREREATHQRSIQRIQESNNDFSAPAHTPWRKWPRRDNLSLQLRGIRPSTPPVDPDLMLSQGYDRDCIEYLQRYQMRRDFELQQEDLQNWWEAWAESSQATSRRH